MAQPAKKTTWSKTLRIRGSANVLVEIGIGDGQRGSISCIWREPPPVDHVIDDWDDVVPADRTLEIDLGPGDQIPYSKLDCVVLVKDVNPSTNRTSVDCKVYQKDTPQQGHEAHLFAPVDQDNGIIAYLIRLTLAQR
jgi:hypothetical protein